MNKRFDKKLETIKRHSKMACKTIQCKIIDNKLSIEKRNYLYRLFLETKWFYNDIIRYGKTENIFNYDYKNQIVLIKNRIGEYEGRHLFHLTAQMRQAIVQKTFSNIKALATKKKRGKLEEVGALKFKTSVNAIPLNQFETTYKIINNKYIRFQSFNKNFRVYGLLQIPKNAEVCNATLVRKATGYYVYITFYCLKEYKEKTKDYIGLDFGLKNNITDSKGNEYSWNFEETEKLKRFQRLFAKTKKGTKKYYLLKRQINKEYEKISNRKEDIANKFVNKLKDYKNVIIQDENLQAWHSSSMKGWGKKIQESILGRIKSKIKMLETSVIIDKFFPSTQLCPVCKNKTKQNLQTEKNIYYTCNHCGYTQLRDYHSAINILFEGLKILGLDEAFSYELRSSSLQTWE